MSRSQGTGGNRDRRGSPKRRRSPAGGTPARRSGRGKPDGSRTGAGSREPGRGAQGGGTAKGGARRAAVDLPASVIREVEEVAGPERATAALEALSRAGRAFTAGQYQKAAHHARLAKDLAPRARSVREVLGLAAYRSGDWAAALSELRAFRRISGRTLHMPLEMDALRGLGRSADVKATWEELVRRGGPTPALKEGKVVLASHLVDEGDVDGAWALVAREARREPQGEADLRLAYVAARVAALRGDPGTAVRLRDQILSADPMFPGIDELDAVIARSGP